MNKKNPQNFKTGLHRNRRRLLISGPVLLIIVGIIAYLFGGRYVSTDDSYVQAARTQISANVSGQVAEIAVKDNQHVAAGDVLFKLDERPFLIAVNDATAKLEQARLQIAALKATYRQRQADIAQAEETLAYQTREAKRQEGLAAQGISSQAQLDQARLALATARQQLTAAKEQSENVLATLGGNPDIDVEAHPSVEAAAADVERAKLNLSYTVVTAPADGIVARVEQLQVGTHINAAQPVFALVSDKNIWVEANFKETELTYMHPDQKAVINLDIYPGRDFEGHVASTSPGTGSSFSLLPPENASGNWVKVVQRVPVRIVFDKPEDIEVLQSGLSASVKVDTEERRFERLWHD